MVTLTATAGSLTASASFTVTQPSTGILFGANLGTPAVTPNLIGGTKLGPVQAVRLFYSGALPTSYNALNLPAGIAAFVSYKTASANTAAFAKSCPAGTRIIYHHEPEGDYSSGAQYVAEFTAQYNVVKAANPNVLMGTASLTYHYINGRVGQTGTYLPPTSSCDFYGCDDYETTPTGTNSSKHPQFLAWYNLIKDRGKPWGFCEYGRGGYPTGTADPYSSARAATLTADTAWLPANDCAFLLYWYNLGTGNMDWRFTDPPSISAWQALRD